MKETVSECFFSEHSNTSNLLGYSQFSIHNAFDRHAVCIAFYPRDAMLARVIAIATCLSVRLSVRHAPVLCQNEES